MKTALVILGNRHELVLQPETPAEREALGFLYGTRDHAVNAYAVNVDLSENGEHPLVTGGARVPYSENWKSMLLRINPMPKPEPIAVNEPHMSLSDLLVGIRLAIQDAPEMKMSPDEAFAQHLKLRVGESKTVVINMQA